MNSLAVK